MRGREKFRVASSGWRVKQRLLVESGRYKTRGSVEGLVCQQSCCVVVRLMVDCFYVDVNSDEIIMDVTSES